MSLDELREEMKRLKGLSIEDPRVRTEFHSKIAWSFAPLFFICLGFPIAVITHRREKSANIILAVFCAAFYYLASLGCEALSVKSFVHPGLIMWVPNFIVASVAGVLNYKCVS